LFLTFLSESPQRLLILRYINIHLLLEFFDAVVDELVVEVLAAEVAVPRGGLHLEELVPEREHCHVEGAPTQVKDQHTLLLLRRGFVQTVGDRSRCRLVYNPDAVQSCYLSSILSSLSLIIIEICGDCNDRISDLLLDVVFDALLQFEKDGR
jgi:NAD-specific glutamate dehydrogenase